MSMNNWIGWGLVVSLFPVIAVSKPGDSDCVVAEFRTLALTVHNPTERLAAATQWLRTHGEACSGKDIALLRSASGAWLGTADSPAIQQVFDFYYNAKGKPENVPPDVPPVPAPATTAVPAPLAVKPKPVVQGSAEKAATTPAKTASSATATNDMATAALASAMATAAASKAASSLSKTK